MGFSMLIVLAILGGWLFLSVAVCLVVGIAIRQADTRDAVDATEPAQTPSSRRKRSLSVA